ncbi:MAG: hypothetical protein LBB61_01440 [Treponema sp.]|jgi:hypothetical protein|nr:hypothetical protein [Treponema sp.]
MVNNSKKTAVFLVILGISFNVFAQDGDSKDVKRFSFGGALGLLPNGYDGGFEFGFLLFHNTKIDIRNHVYMNSAQIRDGNGADAILFVLDEKISMGNMSQNGLFRSYGYIEGGIGFYENETKKLFKTPLAYNYGFGFGIDIFVRDDTGFLIEGGITNIYVDSQWLFNPKITVGACGYL